MGLSFIPAFWHTLARWFVDEKASNRREKL
jgi:hypothetical protein